MASGTIPPSPLTTVLVSTATYSTLYILSNTLSLPSPSRETHQKAISSLHATLTTGSAIYALKQHWPVLHALTPLNLGLGHSTFSDDVNPLIAGRSALGNALTAWETGYLLFDTAASVWITSRSLKPHGSRSLGAAVKDLVRKDPLILFHHLTLLTGLGALQHFISLGRERGVWIITAFLLMNTSTPVLHLRWLLRQHGRGKGAWKLALAVDLMLMLVFAGCRVGVVVWVLREYGKFHGLVGEGSLGLWGVWRAMRGQRWVCQVGTLSLMGVNTAWLVLLARGIARRAIAISTSSGAQRSNNAKSH